MADPAPVNLDFSGSVTITAPPAPPTPYVKTSDGVTKVKQLQKQVNVDQDGDLGPVTMDAAIAATVPNVPVETHVVLYGSSTPPAGVDGAKIAANAATLEGQVGVKLSSHRTYFDWSTGIPGLSGLDKVLADDAANGRASYISIKPPYGNETGWPLVVAQGSSVQAMEDKQAAILKKYTHKIYASFHHEPENDLTKGKVTQAQRDPFRNAHDAWYDAMRSRGVGDNVEIGPTYMHWTLTTTGIADYGTVDSWLPTKYDFIGFDDYNKGLQDDLDFAVAHGVPLAIGEFGKSVAEAGSEQAQADWLQWNVDFFEANKANVVVVCWWNVVKMAPPTMAVLRNAISSAV